MGQPSPTYWDETLTGGSTGPASLSPCLSPGLEDMVNPGILGLSRFHMHQDRPYAPYGLAPLQAQGLHQGLPDDQSIFQFCEGNLNFSTAQNEDDDCFHKRKLSRDPMSHRIIEKRRRDRMNNCLADLSRLIPAEYLKKGRGRVEKTEIIEMAIKHMQYLQSRANLAGIDCTTIAPQGLPGGLQSPSSDRADSSVPETVPSPPPGAVVSRPIVVEHYRLGYQECLSEAMHFLVEVEGYFAGDSVCVKLISHLQRHCDKVVKGDRLNFPRTRQPGEATSSSGSSSSGGATGNSNSDSGIASKGVTSIDTPSLEETPMHLLHGMSQLRETLCSSPPSPTLASHSLLHPMGHGLAQHVLQQHYDHRTDAEHMDSHGEQPSRHLHSPHHCSSHSDSHHHSYKFKNTIKQRFSEEHSSGGLLKRRRRSPSPPSSTPSAAQPSQIAVQLTHAPNASVPIFVLHSKGAFYVPLTVPQEALAPYLDGDMQMDSGSPGVVLHPVTISVNFQQCVKQIPPPHLYPPPPGTPATHTSVPSSQTSPPPIHPWANPWDRTDVVG